MNPSSPLNAFFPVIFLIISLLLNPSTQSILNGYSIEDLITTNTADFQAEAFLWMASELLCVNCNKYYLIPPNPCYSEPPDLILGGPNLLSSSFPGDYSFERSYASLAPHNYIAFTMTFFYFGDYNYIQNDAPVVDLIIDNTLTLAGPRLSPGDISCTPSDNLILAPAIFQGSFAHSSTTLSLTIQSKYPYYQIQFGVREVIFHLSNYSEPLPENSICQTLPTSAITSDGCSCEVGEAVASSGFCQACSQGCQSCFGANSNQCNHCNQGAYWRGQDCSSCPPYCQECGGRTCLSCVPGAYRHSNGSCLPSCESSALTLQGKLYCLSNCPGAADYRYANGACFSSCPFPLSRYEDSYIKACISPCLLPGEILFLDGSCRTSCRYPYMGVEKDGIMYCKTKCEDSQFYMMEFDYCLDSCEFPLIKSTEFGISLCPNPCSSPREFTYSNGSCITACLAPLVMRDEPFGRFCDKPCPNGEFLYWNGSCIGNCPSPLRQKTDELTIERCEKPCPDEQFLRPGGTCAVACESPLFAVSYEDLGIDLCKAPCNQNEYLLLENPSSCLASCPSRFTTSVDLDNIQYCVNPCKANPQGFIYPNSTCSSKCNFSYKSRTEGSLFYCDFICPENSDSSSYYYPEDGSCQKICEYPYQSAEHVCTLILTESQVQQAEKIVETTDVTNSLTNGGIIIGSLIASGDSTSATMGALTKMLSYIKFMNIKFPPKVQLMFYAQSSNSSSFLATPKKLQSEASNKLAPSNFRKYHMSPNFLVNFWQSLLILGIILCVILVSAISLSFLKGFSKITEIINKILSTLRWNLFFALFCGMTGDIVLFSGLEFQTLDLENFVSTLSFLLSIAMNILMLFTLYKILTINSAVRTQKNKTTMNLEGYKAFYEYYKEDSYYQQIFLFIFIIRVSVFNAVIAYLYPYPLAQAIIIVLLNGGILAYLLIKRPMRKIINFIQQTAIEGSLFVFNLCVFILAVLDAQESEDWKTRENLGNVIIAINVATPILSTGIIVIKISLIAKDFYMDYKMSKTTAVQKFDHISIRQSRDLPSIQILSETHQINTLNQTDLQLLPTNNSSPFFVENNSDYSSNLQPTSSPVSLEINSLSISQTDETLINPNMANSTCIRKKPRRWRPRKSTNNLPSEPNLDKNPE